MANDVGMEGGNGVAKEVREAVKRCEKQIVDALQNALSATAMADCLREVSMMSDRLLASLSAPMAEGSGDDSAQGATDGMAGTAAAAAATAATAAAAADGGVDESSPPRKKRSRASLAMIEAERVLASEDERSALNGGGRFEFDSVAEAVADIAAGKFVVVVDDEDRENEGDLIIAAEKMTTEQMAFMIRWTSGLVCVSCTQERLTELELPLMVEANTESHKTAFTHSVDFNKGTTTGISAHDRALTCRALADRTCGAGDFNRPGHMFPLRYTETGVYARTGHTEASVDLSTLAGLQPVAALCEIANDDGTMMRRDDLSVFARAHGLKMITIADLIKHRREVEMRE